MMTKCLVKLYFFLMVAVALSACGFRDASKPGFEVKWLWTDMMYPVPYEAYSENPVFKNKATMQMPVSGTVHRDSLVLEDETKCPLPSSTKVVEEGKHLYGNFCMHCHGATGQGDGLVSAKFLKPPSYTDQRLLAFSSKDIYDVISNGKGVMPPHARQIAPLDRWKIVRYVEKGLQGK